MNETATIEIIKAASNIPFSQSTLGFWIQTGAFILSAIAAVAVIYYNGRVARHRATIDLVLHQKADQGLVNSLSVLYAMERDGEIFSSLLPTMQSDKAKCVRLVLNNMEFISLGIRRGIFDENLYKEMEYSNFLQAWKATRGLIWDIRKSQNRDTFYQEFEWVALRWEKSPLQKTNK